MDRNLKTSMEKKLTAKSMQKLLRLLPKAAQASVSFQNPHSDGANSHKLKTYLGAGPIVSMIPAEAHANNFETQEPSSPKISCIGQIKHKNKLCRAKKKQQPYLRKELKPVSYYQPEKISKARSVGPADELKRKPAGIKKIFAGGRKSVDASGDQGKAPPPLDRAPSLSQMRKFATSRDTLANFDWRSGQIAPCYDEYYSDGEDDVGIGFSAPIIGGLVVEPRKEINLWKRRTMAQPKPLQLNMVGVQ